MQPYHSYDKIHLVIYMNEKFLKRMKEILEDQYDDFIHSLTNEQKKALYFNLHYPINQQFIDEYHLVPHHYVDNGFYYDYLIHSLGKHPYFDCGAYYIQEPSAMIVASLLDVQPNDYILDMCAAPGGKTCIK